MNKEKVKATKKKYRLAHKEAIKKYRRKYYQENKEAVKVYNREYRLAHKETRKTHDREYNRKYSLANPWISHFYLARRRCNNPGSIGYRWYGGKGIKFKLTMGEIKTLYLMYNAKDMEKPSIDRIYNDGHYTFGNCRFIEQPENARRSCAERWKR